MLGLQDRNGGVWTPCTCEDVTAPSMWHKDGVHLNSTELYNDPNLIPLTPTEVL